jgi:hypothetical protein
MSKPVEQIAALAGKHLAACFNNCGVVVNDLKPLRFVITYDPGIKKDPSTTTVEVQDREGEHNVLARVEIKVPDMV